MILARLRNETRDAHESLESQVNILECAASLTSYKNLLGKFYGFYSVLEPRLAEVITQKLPSFEFEARRKVPLLAQDLHALGMGREQIVALPLCGSLPTVETMPRALGCLYVMEGATLGGKIIAGHLQTFLGLDATNGAAFFNGYGGETGLQWRAFGAMLTGWAETGSEDEWIVQAAAETFACLEVWLVQGDKENG